MKVKHEYDQDPRYGWASVDLDGGSTGLIIIVDGEGLSHGFNFCRGEMVKTCICSAWSEGECACPGVDWND